MLSKGKGTLLSKWNLKHADMQITVDLADMHKLGYTLNGLHSLGYTFSMCLRSSAYIC